MSDPHIRDDKKCADLYNEYLELSKKTHIEAQILKAGQAYQVKEVSIDDLVKKEALRKRLIETCHTWLTENLNPGELFDIENG